MMFEQLNSHSCKTYAIAPDGAEAVTLVDPVLDEVTRYLEFFREKGLTLTQVIDTHTHADHISGAPAMVDITGCQYIMHRQAPPKCVTLRVDDGSDIIIGAISARVLHTPGHTKDSICLILPDRILTGDALFLDEGGAGRDDLPGGDPGEHWESLEKLKSLPDSLVVYPAHEYHGRTPSTLGEQKKRNPHLQFRRRENFMKYLEDLRLGPADWMKDVLAANYACARDPKAAWIPADLPACEMKGTMEKSVNEQEVKSIPAPELKKKLDEGPRPVLIDVRESSELTGELGHLEGILHIPIGSLSHRLEELQKYSGDEIVLVCRSGGRAHTAAQILAQAGFREPVVLEGGMLAWNRLLREGKK